MLFDRNIIDGRGMMCSVLTPADGNNQGMGGAGFGKIYDIYFPPEFLRLFDGPPCNIMDTTDVSVCSTDDFTKGVGALVFCIDPEGEERKVGYPNLLLGRKFIGGRGRVCSALTLTADSNQGMGAVGFGKICGISFSPGFLRLSMARPAHHGHDERARLHHR